ncbi:MAG: hypothetical protein ACPLXC_00470 [Candidatus Pacearchaeota archaeon]
MKIDLDSKQLRLINLASKLSKGLLILNEEIYSSIKAKELDLDERGMILGKSLTKEQVINHPIWNELARGSEHLLKDYADFVFKDVKEKFGLDRNMCIGIPSKKETPVLGVWYIERLEDSSNAVGYFRDLVGYHDGRLVGVRDFDLESVVTALSQKRSFRHNGTLYVPVADKEL